MRGAANPGLQCERPVPIGCSLSTGISKNTLDELSTWLTNSKWLSININANKDLQQCRINISIGGSHISNSCSIGSQLCTSNYTPNGAKNYHASIGNYVWNFLIGTTLTNTSNASNNANAQCFLCHSQGMLHRWGILKQLGVRKGSSIGGSVWQNRGIDVICAHVGSPSRNLSVS